MKILDVPRSGSYQGVTSSRNRFGQYVRTRAIPVNPGSSNQNTVRSRMSVESAAWRSLTAGQRAGWEALGTQISRTDALGQSYTLNGFEAFLMVNLNKLAAGDAAVTDAPALASPSAPAIGTVTLSNVAFTIAFTPTPAGAANRIFTYCSPQRAAGRSYEGDYRLVQVSAANAATPIDAFAAYSARFGTPVTGQRIFIALHMYTTGFRSGPALTSAVVS